MLEFLLLQITNNHCHSKILLVMLYNGYLLIRPFWPFQILGRDFFKFIYFLLCSYRQKKMYWSYCLCPFIYSMHVHILKQSNCQKSIFPESKFTRKKKKIKTKKIENLREIWFTILFIYEMLIKFNYFFFSIFVLCCRLCKLSRRVFTFSL